MTRFGYSNDFQVKKFFDILLENQIEDEGRNCSRSGRAKFACESGILR
jgi:hypothetical protein